MACTKIYQHSDYKSCPLSKLSVLKEGLVFEWLFLSHRILIRWGHFPIWELKPVCIETRLVDSLTFRSGSSNVREELITSWSNGPFVILHITQCSTGWTRDDYIMIYQIYHTCTDVKPCAVKDDISSLHTRMGKGLSSFCTSQYHDQSHEHSEDGCHGNY